MYFDNVGYVMQGAITGAQIGNPEIMFGINNEEDLLSALKDGFLFNVKFYLKREMQGVICFKDGRAMIEIPPQQNGKSPVYVFALQGSLISFDDLIIL